MARGISKKRQIKVYAKNAVLQMLKWAQEKYNLSDKINDPIIIISFDPRREFSYGGWSQNRKGQWRPYINLAVVDCLKFKPETYKEYDHYKSDPDIGNKWITTWKAKIRYDVAHEISHAIQDANQFLNPEQAAALKRKFGRSNPADAHSKKFQKIYRAIRKRFVNGVRKIK